MEYFTITKNKYRALLNRCTQVICNIKIIKDFGESCIVATPKYSWAYYELDGDSRLEERIRYRLDFMNRI